ncbi:MAG: extracellular solute-binding protein [Clostridia bacterium]|nr:extracellular solute-binding protein [Clostridia bacterium]
MAKRSRLMALLLVALMASQTLVSCGSTDNPLTGGDTTVTDTTVPEETGYEVYHDLEGLNYNGEEFTIWIGNTDSTLVMEEETGDILDDTVYARNRSVEEQLNIKLNMIEAAYGSTGAAQNEIATAVRGFIMSGDDSYDVYQGVQHTGYPAMINEGMFHDWNTVPNVDLTKPYWYQGAIKDINYGSKIYMLTGSYSLGVMSSANCLFFNKRLLEEAQIEYPYQMVLDGTWTFDKWVQMVADTTRDLNGDTVIDPKVDQYGYWGWGYEQVFGLFLGMGGDIVTKDNDNLPLLDVVNERNIEIIDKMNALFQMDGAAMEWTDSSIFRNTFISGNLAFLHGSLGWATGFRDMEDDFGFVPYPKLDEDQENYNVRIQNTANMTYIPVTNTNLEFTGAVLEVMAAESYNTVIPTYFDVVLTVKTTRDTESEQMVPIILDSTSFWDSAVTSFSLTGCVKGGNALTTYYAGVQTKVEDNIKTIIETYTGVKAEE